MMVGGDLERIFITDSGHGRSVVIVMMVRIEIVEE